MTRTRAILLGLAGLALLATGCGGSSSAPSKKTSATTAIPSSTATTALPASTDATTTPPAPTTTAAGAGLTGMGATVGEMKSAHGSDSGPGATCTASNSCFGAGLKNDDSGETYQFTDASVAAGMITGYQQNFTSGTSISDAQSQILQGMPKDATISAVTIDNTGGSCAMFNVTSPTLATLFSDPSIGDPQGVVGVELSYIDSSGNITYDPNNVQSASLSVSPSDPTASC